MARNLDAFDTLVNDIMLNASLQQQEATGFYAIYCPVCQKENKKTGGFKFETEQIIYNCFRGSCDASCVYTKGEPISRKFRQLMSTINVQIPLELRMVKSSFQKKIEELDNDLYKKHSYSPADKFEWETEYFEDYEGVYKARWDAFLERRRIPLKDVYIITDGKYRGNLMIPNCINGITTGYHIITEYSYILLGCGNSNAIYIPNGYVPNSPVIIVEGLLDAKCFPHTIATLSNKLTPEQAYQLRYANDVIMLPDKSGGNRYIDQFEDYGWKICIPPWKEKDLNSAVIKYGLFVTARMIRENCYDDRFRAKIALKRWENQ